MKSRCTRYAPAFLLMEKIKTHIILFDGICNLCSCAVQFLIMRDKKRVFRYASLQSKAGQKLTALYNIPSEVDSIILLKNNNYYAKSCATIEVIKELKWYWKIFLFIGILPKKIRDWLYDFVAKNRYKWFGRKHACMVPTPELKSLFLESVSDL